MNHLSIVEAKKKLSSDALAHALAKRAEAAGQSLTEWLADEEHVAELRCGSSGATDESFIFSRESKK